MTEVKIPFTKIEAERYSGSDKPANKEELSLKIVSTFNFNQVYEKMPPNSSPVHMRLNFIDGAEMAIYNELLDDNKVSFELSFEKEKVEFYVVGEENRDVDESKPIIDYIPFNNKDRISIRFEPKFSGVIKITSTSQPRPNSPNPPPLTTTIPSRLNY